jgi:hypothetical protein
MRSVAYVVTILLLASILVGFSSATSSYPAQVVTSYSYSEVPVATITWTSTLRETLYSNSFPVPAAGGGLHSACNIIDDDFTAQAGQITGTVSTTYPIDFYLLSQAQYSEWSKLLVFCSGPGSYLVEAQGISSVKTYHFNVDLATAGQYYIIFFNQSSSLTPNLVVNIMSVGTAETYTATSHSFYTQKILVTGGPSQSSSQQQLQTNSLTLGQNGSVLALGIVAIIVVALVALVMKKRRKTETRTVSAKPAVVASDTMFCRKCGAKIPRDSTFCKECGEKTTKA